MNRELLLLRHGKAVPRDGQDDFERELRNKGKRHAQRIGVWLAQNKLVPDHVISSSAERARNTAAKCCKAMGLPAYSIDATDALYRASPEILLQHLRQVPEDKKRVMLVGHNPGLEQLLERLCEMPPPRPHDHKLLPTGTVAHLAFRGLWRTLQAGQAHLLAIQPGARLPSTFPFPSPDSDEQRNRPAYYYTQSSVIPYRIHEGELQVMIVRSSSDRHWVVPKGIADPGMSSQASALKEALEEAGVQGQIAGAPLGRYLYSKWGADCSVDVYAMQVDTELPEKEWEEKHRGRRWVAAETAALLLKQTALEPMIEKLVARLAGTACPA